MTSSTIRIAGIIIPLAGAAALAACAPEAPTYEADATDESGGELIVTEETPAIDVDLPETEMTMVPAGEPGESEIGAE